MNEQSTMRKEGSFIIGFLLLSIQVVAGEATTIELPQYSDEEHLGVASCASGVCHGSVRPRSSTPVLQNEYVVWSRLDSHRQAYNTLLSKESEKIATNMGLKNAHEADVCLDCHADNVAANHRGKRFQINDGVSCEACHGGAEKYLNSHTDENVPRSENIKNGLYPTDRLGDRARLCFSCHIGSEEKIASHEIMGAGHPRLSFELDTFGVLQPAHYVVDEDYKESKWSADSLTIWALGQVEAGKQTLRLVSSKLDGKNLFPELSLFDCHACHHPMSDKKWQNQAHVSLPPGSVRLNDGGLLMLFPIARVYAPALYRSLHVDLKALHSHVNAGSDITGVVAKLQNTLASLSDSIVSNGTGNSASRVLGELVSMGSKGQFRDYVAAEQSVMAIDMLLSTVGKREKNSQWLDKLYDSVIDEDTFDPVAFSDVMSAY